MTLDEQIGIPYLTTAQMENAGRNLAQLCRARFFAGDPGGRAVVVLVGRGGKGWAW